MRGTGALLVLVLAGCATQHAAEHEAVCRAAAPGAGGARPLVDGESLPVVLGPQGFYMVVAAALAEGIDPGDPNDVASPENPDYSVALSDPDGLLAKRAGQLGLAPRADGWLELVEARLIFGRTPPATEAPCQLRVALADHLGHSCSTAVTIGITPP